MTKSDIKRYDIAVIGAGMYEIPCACWTCIVLSTLTHSHSLFLKGAGAKISTPSSHLGYKVALCEKDRLGGTCLNRGCIPSKMLIHPADVAQTIDTANRYNVQPSGYSVDFKGLVERVAGVIDEESFSINPRIEANPNIDWYREPVRFVGKRLLQAGETVFTADKIFIAAGSRPRIPDIPGLADTPYMTSTEALLLTEQPKTLGVIGAGYIACELSHYFSALGTQVNMFVRSRLISHEDHEVGDEFTRVFSKNKNMNLVYISSIELVQYDESEKKFTIHYVDRNSGERASYVVDNLLVAAGVVPNADLLEVEKSGIEVDENGFIKVDDHLRTSVEDVWAFGDIAGNFLFRHSANYEGDYLMETVIRRKEMETLDKKEVYPIDYRGMPHAVFSSPQVAGVGETEEELKARGAQYVVGKNNYSASAMGMALRSDSGFVKLMIEKGTRKILGCHIVGHEASVLIHQIIPLVRTQGTLDDLLYMVYIHPALSEIVRNAARKARDALLAADDPMPLLLKLK